MDAHGVPWDDVRYFLAVAQAGTVSGAGKALGVNHSTVLRRIASLEERLGTRLFDRQARGYVPTPLGERLVPIAGRIGDEMHGFSRLAFGADQTLRGEIRVTTVVDCGDLVCKHLRGFYAEYPEVRLRALIGERLLRLGDREADVAIRPVFEPPSEPDVVARRVCGIATAPYASRAYLARHGHPRRRRDLIEHAMIVGSDAIERIPLVRWVLDNVPEHRVVYRSNNFANQVTALLAGFGVGIAPCWLCDPQPDLVRLLEPELSAELWLLYHQDLRSNVRVRAFADYMYEALQGETELIEGRSAMRERAPSETRRRAGKAPARRKVKRG